MWAHHPCARCNDWKKQHCCNVSVTIMEWLRTVYRACVLNQCVASARFGMVTILSASSLGENSESWSLLSLLILPSLLPSSWLARSFSDPSPAPPESAIVPPLFFQRLIFVVPRAGRASSSRTYFRRHTAIR